MKSKSTLILAVSVIFSTQLLGESGSKKKRGGSCTENCTAAGKEAVSDLEAGIFGSDRDQKRAKEYVDEYDNLCGKKPDVPGNLSWCQEQCSGKGGIYTKLFNKSRKAEVEKFVTIRENSCKDLKPQVSSLAKERVESIDSLATLLDRKKNLDQKLDLISEHAPIKAAFEKLFAEKIKAKSLLTWESTVRSAAEKEPEGVALKAIQQKLLDKKIPTDDASLKDYQVSLEAERKVLEKDLAEKAQSMGISPASEQSLKELTAEGEALRNWPRDTGATPQVENPQAEAETTKLAPIAESILADLESFIHKDVALIWRGLFAKFPNAIKIWEMDAEGKFKIELNTPIRMWVPPSDDPKDPKTGVVLTLGLDEKGNETKEVSGALNRDNKEMVIENGAYFFVRPDQKQATPGFVKLSNIRYFNSDEIHIITQKNLRNDFSGLLLKIVGAIAKSYGPVDENYILTVTKKKSLEKMIKSWTTDGKAVDNEREAVGLK